MNKVNIQFGGMANIPDESVAQDGQMAVLMNMRHKGGELVNSLPPSSPASLGNVEQMLYHNNSKRWLVLNNGVINVYKEDYSADGDISAKGVKSFALLGNIVVINLENDVVYAIWRDNKFVYLGAVPMPPEMGIKTSGVLASERAIDTISGLKAFADHSTGLFDKCLATLYEKGVYVDNAIFIVAIRFFDGTYRYSHWYFIRNEHKASLSSFLPNGFGYEIDAESNFLTTGTSPNSYPLLLGNFCNHVIGFYPEFDLSYDLSEWKDIITSIDIFSSGSIMGQKRIESQSLGETYCKKGIPLLRKEIEEYSMFRKVAEYNLKGELVYKISNTSPSNLNAQDELPVSNRREILSDKEFVFNNKLHVVKKEEKPEIATDNVLSINGDDMPIVEDCPSYIEFKNGNVIHHTLEKYYNKAYLPYLISQPMKGIVRQEIKIENNLKLDVNYKENPNMDMSVALNGSGEFGYRVDYDVIANVTNMIANFFTDPMYTGGTFRPRLDETTFMSKALQTDGVGYSSRYEVHILENEVKIITPSNTKTMTITEAGGWGISRGTYMCDAYLHVMVNRQDTLYTIDKFAYQIANFELKKEYKEPVLRNILKVSAQDNPFYFPNGQTYMFDGEIKGLASNAEAISQGQFGQYPLFVFTTEGIWAMQVDSTGKGAYTTQTPFSREVCNGEVCPVSGGIIFTTDRGVMAISGNQVTEISAPLDGDSPDYINSTSIFAKIYEAGEFNSKNLLVPENIRTYIKGAKIAYNYLHNEVILSNANKGYSYVYQIDSQRWSMTYSVFDITTNSYPELVVYNNKSGVVLVFADRNKYSYSLAITRPFTLGTLDFKRLRQAALRYKGEGYAYFYVLGSNDGREFVCLTGKEFMGRDNDLNNRDLVTPMSRSRQCKYFAIAVALPNFSGSVSLAELLVDAGLANNKLR